MGGFRGLRRGGDRDGIGNLYPGPGMGAVIGVFVGFSIGARDER